MSAVGELHWHGAPITGATVIIGIFDGVHKGHQTIINRALTLNAPVVALTFYPHPAAVISDSAGPSELLTLNERVHQLMMHGVSSVAVIDFTNEFSKLTPDLFISEVLRTQLDAKALVVGTNFRFGVKASGDSEYLKAKSGIPVFALDLESELGNSVSSTRIREAVIGGNIEIARELLTRPHQLVGPVVHGEKRGRQIGYPTANIEVSPNATIPSDGVYAGWLTVGTHRWPAAISIGTNPTFDGVRGRQIEAYALDQSDLDLYGQVAKVEFGWRLRDTIKFSGLDPLLAQMKIDCDKARELTKYHA
ncbi:MAG: bifunctional riboflavin kinase/FAD synthetase [Candidatus Nanopelagicaceae bacterium]